MLPKIGLFFGSFRGFFRIPGIISRNWPQNWLKLGANTKYEVSEMNLRCFLKLGSFLEVCGAFFFRISGIISRTWPKNWLKLGTNTKCEFSEMNLRCFLKLRSLVWVPRAFWRFQGLFSELVRLSEWIQVLMFFLK